MLSDKILAGSRPLSSSGATGIGAQRKFAGMGINWKYLKAFAF